MAVYDAPADRVALRVTAGLTRIAMVLRTQAWKGAKPEGVTPTQAQALEFLRGRPLGLRQLAELLGVATPTATVAVNTLVGKGLVQKAPGRDRRSVVLALTPSGEDLVGRLAGGPDVLSEAVESLPEEEQAAVLVGLVKIIRSLQLNGHIAPQRTCVSCSFFRPRVHPDPTRPHHCAFVDAPFGDRHLRLDCPEQQDAPLTQQQTAWETFAGSTAEAG